LFSDTSLRIAGSSPCHAKSCYFQAAEPAPGRPNPHSLAGGIARWKYECPLRRHSLRWKVYLPHIPRSVLCCSHRWSKLLIAVTRGKLQRKAGGRSRGLKCGCSLEIALIQRQLWPGRGGGVRLRAHQCHGIEQQQLSVAQQIQEYLMQPTYGHRSVIGGAKVMKFRVSQNCGMGSRDYGRGGE
jgi:hypothetical protein